MKKRGPSQAASLAARSDVPMKPFIVIGLLCIGFVVMIVVLDMISKVVDERPERQLSKSFLINNSAIQTRFGQPITVEYKPEGSTLSFHRDKTKGQYRFRIVGSKESGEVSVQWESSVGFQVNAVELLFRNGSKPAVLYEKEF